MLEKISKNLLHVSLPLRLYYILLILQQTSEILCDDSFPYAKIPSGELQGVYLKTPKGKTYEAFLGVRYAAPPLGDLRFKEAQPISPWIGIYNASTYGSDCLQYTHFGYKITGSEDCLFINIYKPLGKSNDDGSLLDVMVNLHAGAFMFYSPQGFKPDKLMDHDIVYASINYRLGPLGFLSTGDKVLPGNLGMKDQVTGLKWVKDNIRYFGGDPNKVTLTGVSAGAASVQYHYLSPLSRGLFHRGLSSSGSALNPWSLAENIPEKSKIIASKLGCPTTDSSLMIKCLIERPAEQIVSQIPSFMGFLYNPFTPFGPSIEPEDAVTPFMNRHPYDIIKDGDIAHVPWISGFTTEEGLYPAAEFVENPELMKELERNWYEYAPHLLDYNFTTSSVEEKNKITDIITKHYLKGKKISEGSKELIQMVGDRLFGAGIVQGVLMQAAKSKAPVFLYHFGYRGTYSVSEDFTHSNVDLGVCHADDSGYVFEADLYNMEQSEEDRKIGERLINLYISFTKKGKPEFFDNVPLPTVKEALPNVRYLKINSPDDAVVETKTDLSQINFWSSLPLKEKLQRPNQSKDEL